MTYLVLLVITIVLGHSIVSNSFANPKTVAHRAPLSMGFLRQEYWSDLPFPFPGDLPNPGIEPMSPGSAALAGRFFTTVSLETLYIRKLLELSGKQKNNKQLTLK